MRYLKFFATLLFLSTCFHLSAQNAPDSMIHRFFSKYQEKRNDALYDIYASNPWKSSDEVYAVKTRLSNTVTAIGKYIGYELITRKSIGDNFILCSYMVRYEREPVRFTFVFYRSKDSWILYDLKFDDDLESELQKAASAQWLPENTGSRK